MANGLFSTLSGLSLFIFHHAIAMLFNVTLATVFWIVGIVLLFFSLTVFIEYGRQRKLYVRLMIIQDLIWVVASIFLLIFQPFGISLSVRYMIGLTATIVMVFSILQIVELKMLGEKNLGE